MLLLLHEMVVVLVRGVYSILLHRVSFQFKDIYGVIAALNWLLSLLISSIKIEFGLQSLINSKICGIYRTQVRI